MPALREVQAAFRHAVLDGDDGALAALVAEDGIAAPERLAVHRNNVRISLADVLRAAFPAVCRLVDERFFAYAAHAFVAAQPPRGACLADYGAGFADFLAEFPPCREIAYLADVARFEWLMQRAAHAADSTPLAPAALTGVAAKDTPRLVLRLDPALGYLASPFPIDRIWRANRPDATGDAAVALGGGGVHLEIGRRGADVVFRALDAATFALRRAMSGGAPLAAATVAALAANPAFDLAAAIADLFRDGAVVALTQAPEAVP